MNYQYVAYTNEWKIVKGAISVATEVAAEQALIKRGYQPITIKQQTSTPMPNFQHFFPSLFSVKPKDVIMFSRQLATLLGSGITMVPALNMLQEQMSNRILKEATTEILDDLRAGSSFSGALVKHTKIFGEVFCKLASVGEQSGSLESSLKQAAIYVEKDSVAKKKIQRALTYPTIVLVVALVVVTVMIVFVLPQMTTMFTSMGADLPLTTKLLIGIIGFAASYKLHILVAIVVLVVIAIAGFRQPAVRYKLDRLLLTVPILGPVNLMNEMAHFSQTTSLLIHAGLSLPDIMNIAQQTSGNRVMCEALSKVRQGLVQGEGISAPMLENKLFPRLLVQMVRVGEETGNLESTLNIVAESYETEANDKLSGLIAMIEPTMTVGLGLLVAFVALSVISPMYSILSSFG